MKKQVIDVLKEETSLSEKEIENLIETPPSPELGDYAFPCFVLAKQFGKSPNEIASELSIKISSKHFEKIEVKGPYINFFIDKKALAESTLSRIKKEKEKYGSQKYKNKVMVEFSQTNTHKAFHIGHIRGTSLGESISRILEFSGNKVIRANYQGDTGMHVAKWIWNYKKNYKKTKLSDDESWIAGIYVDAVKRIEANPNLQEEVDEVNRELESKKDKSLLSLWKRTRRLSLRAFDKIYKDFNTKFDRHFFESQMESKGKKISEELFRNKIAEISDGALIVDLNKYDLGIWVLLRKDGTVLYSAKDLALAREKFEKNRIQKSIYIVGSAQNLYFKQLFKTLELMKFKHAKDLQHVSVTEVRFPWGKMSSRTGENTLYSEFRKEIVEYTIQEIKKRHDIGKKEIEKRAEVIALAALKYSMLKQDTNKGVIFDKKTALNFEGNTGPYLLYTYARAKSILRKAKPKKFSIKEINDSEKSLLLQISQFPEAVIRTYSELSPSIIANYSYQLSKCFNEFYHSHKVVGSENEAFRLALVECFAQVLKNSLYLLGISTLEKM